MLRFLIGLPLAALVTAGLFFLMQGLVKPGDVEIGRTTEPITFPGIRTDTDPSPPEFVPDAVIPTDPPPQPFTQDRGQVDQPSGGPSLPPRRPGGDGDLVIEAGPSGLFPIATIAPTYPPSCAGRGTEGYAVVSFDVTWRGGVTNARVIDRSDRCFEKAALSAIRGWRYRPAMTEGDGYIARGVTKRFAFQLD